MSPDAIAKRFRRMIEVYATKARTKWNLPVSAEQELQSYGNQGLSEALARFDATLGFELNTYAEHRVRGAIQNGAKALHHAKRVGASSLAASRDHDAGDKWDRILDLFEDVTAGATIAFASQADSAEDDMAHQEQCELLRTALASLPQRRQDLLRWLFLDEVDGTEVASRLGVHKSRLSHLKSQALSQLSQRFSELEDPLRGT
jgi:RNA polymerase sigma factor (sigma-70 family)